MSVVIADRSLPAIVWKIRRQFGDLPEAGPAFAKWLADPARGRFLVIDKAAKSIEAMLVNVEDEATLVVEIANRLIEASKLPVRPGESDAVVNFEMDWSHTASAVQQKLERMVYELNTIIRTGDYPPDGWKGPSGS